MALSSTIYTITAPDVGKTTFDLVFEGATENPPGYLAKSHIFMWLNDVQVTVGGGGSEYDGSGITFTFPTSTTVEVTGHAAELADVIEFRRTLPTDKPVVDFVDRAGITEAQLDTLALSVLYASHENKDGYGTGTQTYYTLAKLYATAAEDTEVETGKYSALHYAAKAAASAAAAAADEILTNADAAATAADAIATAADAASTAADLVQTNLDQIQTTSDAADTAADLVLTNADVVLTHADVVLTNADVVTTNADAATTTQDAIDTAADAASTAADAISTAADAVSTAADVVLANKWAEEDEDVEVTAGAYSAKHWAAKSAATGDYLPLAGGTMTGEVVLNGSPTLATHAVPKSYIDAKPNPNLLINGGFDVAQRGTSGSDGYIIDMWEMVNTTTVNTSTVTLNDASIKRLLMTNTTTGSTIIQQKMESSVGGRLQGKVLTFSGWISNNAGDPGLILQLVRPTTTADDWSAITVIESTTLYPASTATGSYIFYSFTFAAVDDGTKGLGIRLYRASDASGSTTLFAQLKLEVGTEATAFDEIPYGEILAKCQRYYCKAAAVKGCGCQYNGTYWRANTIPFPVEMMAAPTVTIASAAPVSDANIFSTGATAQGFGPTYAEAYAASGVASYFQCNYVAESVL